jgi:lipopolysaccharide/colanic/teichoic acid biosynthesis glycosyltransferase
VSVLIKLTSKGPVFFRQRRVGKFGKEFEFLRFRTMIPNNDPRIHQAYVRKFISERGKGEGLSKSFCCPRETLVGRFLRKSGLDELPQFINVLKGEMSLVGPARLSRTRLRNIVPSIFTGST